MQRLEYYSFDCIHCENTWIIVNPKRVASDYFCPFCGEKQIHKESFDDVLEDQPEEQNEDSDETVAPTIRTTVVEKTKDRLFAEDRMTEKMCQSGWWNPLTKKCMGTGVGFKSVDNNDD